MNIFTDLLKKEQQHHLLLGIFFIAYLVLNVQTPDVISQLIDTTFGSIIVMLFALALFMQVNPIIGILGLAVAFEMIRRSNIDTGSFAIKNYVPSEEKKLKHMKLYNNTDPVSGTFKKSLEEELVEIHNIEKRVPTESYIQSEVKACQADTKNPVRLL
jgi:hypothetical protein